ncbi:MAG: hypothetical protein K6E10_05825 [Eubacterium sp.]|nr:hypothetical protein [Eubacterium sp.]
MDKIKNLLKGLRDGTAYSFSWLMVCLIVVLILSGNETVSTLFLIKLFIICVWGSLSFTICFRNRWIEKKGFMFSLTCFYILFIPVEILMFYMMGLFKGNGSLGVWIVFFSIVIILYIISLIIDRLIMTRKADIYTKKLSEYKSKE